MRACLHASECVCVCVKELQSPGVFPAAVPVYGALRWAGNSTVAPG